ncbi:uncharacterized protein DFL_003147 [Arthrobotrys flagrans]|uniref:Uncharacterized protein n=1 Tax=Arthrobotrys flagrans TaxID=97331 RepID=A0A437A0T0_ARTFL|nr:hypothetical protein DFL_003147 [Arthrobotrys flagrans]
MKPQTFLIMALLFLETSLAVPQSYAGPAASRRPANIAQRDVEGQLPPGTFKSIMIKQLTASINDPNIISVLNEYPPKVFDELYQLKGEPLATAIQSLLDSAGLSNRPLPASVGRVPKTSK